MRPTYEQMLADTLNLVLEEQLQAGHSLEGRRLVLLATDLEKCLAWAEYIRFHHQAGEGAS